jgi:acyl carrier protein
VQGERARVTAVIKNVFPEIPPERYGAAFEWLEIDSFDLVTLRVSLEEEIAPVSDQTWVAFTSLGDILEHYPEP